MNQHPAGSAFIFQPLGMPVQDFSEDDIRTENVITNLLIINIIAK